MAAVRKLVTQGLAAETLRQKLVAETLEAAATADHSAS